MAAAACLGAALFVASCGSSEDTRFTSVGSAVTDPPSPSTHRCLESSETFTGDVDGDDVGDRGDVCLTGRNEAQVVLHSSKCGLVRSDPVGAMDPHGIYGSLDNGDGTRLILANAYNHDSGPNLDVFVLNDCSLRSVRENGAGIPGQFILNLVNERSWRNGVTCERINGRLQFVLRKSDRAGEGRWRTSTFRWTVEKGEARNVGSDYDGPTLREQDLPQPDHSLDCEGIRSPT